LRGRIYDTQRWKRLRRLKLQANPLCERCRAEGKVVAATQVDHVLAVERGGAPFDFDNLMSLCAACHSRKTSAIEVHRGDHVHVKGCDTSGMPLCPCHPWSR
jgi:5-methylcytosine-specific restriction protein A